MFLKKNKCSIKRIILLSTLIMLLIIAVIAIYCFSTANNKYYIGNKNLNIPILVYHDIIKDNEEIEFDYMQTKISTAKKQIKGLKNLGYHFITYEELEKYKNGEIPLYKHSCIVTFDDGYEGVYENFYPFAREENIPFTIFIINYNMELNEYCSWEKITQMSESGIVTIASHSTDHPNFQTLNVKQAVDNVNESNKEIEERLGKKKVKVFTYPYGLYNEEEITALEKEGYIQNLTDNKINKSDKLDLSRLHREYPLNDSLFVMMLKIYYRSIRY